MTETSPSLNLRLWKSEDKCFSPIAVPSSTPTRHAICINLTYNSPAILLVSGPVHITPEKFENGVSTPKTHQMFSVHTTPEKFENVTITGAAEKLKCTIESEGSSHDYQDLIVFENLRFQNCFSSALKRKPDVFKPLRFE